MMKNTAILAILLLAGGCSSPTRQSVERGPVWHATEDEVRQAGKAIAFAAVASPSTKGFLKHWSLGSRSAWYNMESNEVLVIDTSNRSGLRISGFPGQYGHVVATGWEDNSRFFVHLSPGSDSGTMIYMDLGKRTVTRMERWAAF